MAVGLALLFAVGGLVLIFGLWLPALQRDPVDAYVVRRFGSRMLSLEQVELEHPFSERVLRPAVQWFAGQVQRLGRKRDRRQRDQQAVTVQQRLNLAGSPHGWTPVEFLGVKALTAFLAGSALFLLVTLVALRLFATVLATGAGGGTMAGLPVLGVLAAAAGAAIGFIAPDLYLRYLIAERQRVIQRSLSDALDILCVCLEAGVAFDGAVRYYCRRAEGPIAREFGRMLQELQMGRPRRGALMDLVARTGVADLAAVVNMLIQAEQLGTPISKVLAIQADQARTQRRLRAEELAAQASLKMLIPLALFVFPSICVVILGPLWPLVSRVSTTPP
jgi:tight adherence protein C